MKKGIKKLQILLVLLILTGLSLFLVIPSDNASVVDNVTNTTSSTAYSNGNGLLRSSNGTLFAAYVIYETSVNHVYFAKSYDNGTTWIGKIQIYAGYSTDGTNQPNLFMDEFGYLYYFYCGRIGGSAYAIGWKKSTNNGTTWVEQTAYSLGNTPNVIYSVAMDGNRNFHMVWSSGTSLNYAYFDGSWSAISNIGAGNYYRHPDIAIDKHNEVHIVAVYAPSGYYYLHYLHIQYPFVRCYTYKLLYYSTQEQFYPNIAVDSNDKIHIVWFGRLTITANAERKIYYRNSSDWGVNWGPLCEVQTTMTYGDTPVSLSLDANNNVRVAWQGDTDDAAQSHIHSAVKYANSSVWRAGNSTLFDDYLAVAHTTSPNMTIYKRSGDTFNKLADPTLPNGTGKSVSWSNDGIYLAVAQDTNPYVSIYKRSGDTFTKLANPDILPNGSANGVAWSYNSNYLVVTHAISPYVTIYKRSGDAFTKLADPLTLPTGTGYGVSWSYDDKWLAIAHDISPYVTIYKRSGDAFTKLANPGTLPTGIGRGVSFSRDSIFLSVAHDTSPYVTTYTRSADTFTKLSNPGTLPTGNANAIKWSSDNQYLVVAHATSPYITIYKRSIGYTDVPSTSLTKLTNPGTLPTGTGRGVSWSYDMQYLVVSHDTSPYITIYKRTGLPGATDTFTKLTNPGTLPTGIGYGVDFTQPLKKQQLTSSNNNHYYSRLFYQTIPFQYSKNIPQSGYAFLWTNNTAVNFYKSNDLSWYLPPSIAEYPLDTSILMSVTPTCTLTVNGKTPMTIYWYEKSTGSWILRQTNSSVNNGTYRWVFSQASAYGTTYQWKVAIDDGTINTTKQFNFTTKYRIISDIRSPPYFTVNSYDYPSHSICRGCNGNLYAIYVKRATGSSIRNVFFAKSTDNGASWTEKQVTTFTTYDYTRSPNIAIDSKGVLHIVYPCRANTGTYYLYYQKSTDEGNTWSTAVDVGYGNYEDQSPADIVVDSKDNVYVAWSVRSISQGSGKGYYWRKYTKSTGSWGSYVQISSESSDDRLMSPSLTVDGNDNLHAAWINYRYVRYRYYNGTHWQTTRNVYDTWGMYCPHIAVDSNNKISVVWQDQNTVISYMSSTDLGVTWSARDTLNSANSYSPSIAIDKNNYIHIFWIETDSNSNLQLWSRKYTTSWQVSVKLTNNKFYTTDNHFYPTAMYAKYPYQIGKSNQPSTGSMLIWVNRTYLTLYKSSDLSFGASPYMNINSPINNSVDSRLNTVCNVSVYSNRTMDVYWYENSTGSWVLRQINSSVGNGSYTWKNNQATHYDAKYWFRVSANDGLSNVTRVFYYKTTPFQSSSYPNDNSIDEGLHIPIVCSITATHPEGKSMNVYWYENHTGSIKTNDWTYSGIAVYGSRWFSQTFIPSKSITGISVYSFRVGNPGTVTVSIRATDVNGKPTGGDLASVAVNGNNWRPDQSTQNMYDWHDFFFSNTVELTPGTKYAMVIRAPSGGGTQNCFYLGYSGGNSYANGSYVASTDSGSTWTITAANDFTMYVHPIHTLRQTNSSVNNGTYRWSNTIANYDTTFYWKVSINDSSDNTTRTYSFTPRYEYPVAHIYNSVSFADSGRKSICRSSSGTLYAVYLKTATVYNVFFAKSTDNGASWTETQLTSYTTYHQGIPTICIDSTGVLHIVYYCQVNGGTQYLYYRKSTDGGTIWSTALDIGSGNQVQSYPYIAVDGNDNLHVVWRSDGGTVGILYKKYTTATSTWGAIVQLTSNSNPSNPSIVIDKDNHIHVAWSYSQTVYYRYFDGVSWQTTRTVYNAGGTNTYINLIVDSNNKIYVFWRCQSGVYWAYSTDFGVNWAGKTYFAGYGGFYTVKSFSVSQDQNNNMYLIYQTQYDTLMIKKYNTTLGWSDTYCGSPFTHSPTWIHSAPSMLWARYPSYLNANIPKTGYVAIWLDELRASHTDWVPAITTNWDLYYRESPDLTFDVEPPVLTLVSPANNSLIDRQTWANLSINISGYGTADVSFYNATGNVLLHKYTGVGSGLHYWNWSGLTQGVRHYWYVVINGTYNTKSSTWNFIPNDEPTIYNLRIETINENNITVAWENEPNMEWISLLIENQFSEVRKILGFYQEWDVPNLFKNTGYDFTWQVGDNITSMSEYYGFDFRTFGWKPDLEDYSYRKLITIDNSTVEGGVDLENYALNLTLTDDNFQTYAANWWDPVYPAFTHMNYTSQNDIRFVNYYDTNYLPFNITYWNVPGNGGIEEQVIPDEYYYTGSFATPSDAHDGDWLTQATPTPYGILYYNYTIPVGAKTSSKFRTYQGEWVWDVTLPEGAFNGAKLQFRSICDYETPYISTQVWDYDSLSWVLAYDWGEYGTSNSTSRYFYESQMTWEYDVEVRISLMPEHFNDALRGYGYGLDADYDVKFWMYYGNADAINNETALTYDGLSNAGYALSSEEEYTIEPPVISNIQENNITATSINISWATDELADQRIRYATNPWFFGSTWAHSNKNKTEIFEHLLGNETHNNKLYVYSPYFVDVISVICSNSTFNNNPAYYWINSSTGNYPAEINFNDTGTDEFLDWTVTYTYNKTIEWAAYTAWFNISGLPTDTKYYYQIQATGEGGITTSDGDFTLGTPPSTPHGNIEADLYDEDRPNATVNIWGDLTDMNSNPSIDVSIQYWNESSTDFSETTATQMLSTGLMNKTIPVDYGHTYYYRLKMVDTTTGYSEVYSNDFMEIQEFFAGSYIEDEDNNGENPDYRDREYRAPNPDGTVNLSAKQYIQYGYWEGSLQEEDWMWVETNETSKGALTLHLYTKEFGHVGDYPMINDTDSDMRYIKLTGLDSSWYTFYITGTGGQIVLNWTKPSMIHLNTESRKDESKYVSFDNAPQPISYTLLYLDYQDYNSSAYRWSIASGLDLYSAMAVEYWGGGRESGLTEEHTGTEYDRGQLFRGGIINGEPRDTGELNSVRPNKELGAYRYCFAFTSYWWNLSLLPSNNITNYYYHWWSMNSHWSDYLGYPQTRLFDYNYLMHFTYDQISYTRDWAALDGTTISTENRVANASADVFGSDYDQSLLIGYKNGFNVPTDNDEIWNFGLYTDGRWTNQQLGQYQQAFVIFNLPDDTTLQGMDSDSDGLNDYDELFVYYTNPKSDDTDEDGQEDGFEVNDSHNPNLYTDLNSEPIVSISKPENNTTYYKLNDLDITVSISEPDGDGFNYNISLYATNGTFLEAVQAGINDTFIELSKDFSAYADGQYIIKVTAEDTYSHETIENRFFYLNSFYIGNASIANGTTNVPIDITSWSIYIIFDDTFDWSIETSPNIGSSSANGDTSGKKVCPLSGLNYSTVYYIYINTTEGNEIYWFSTANSSYLEISVSPGAYNFGNVWPGQSYQTGGRYYNLTNNGISCDIQINCSNTQNWTRVNYSDIGLDKFAMNWTKTNWVSESNILVNTVNYLAENVPYNTIISFGIKIFTPAYLSTLTDTENLIITFETTAV